MARPDLSYLKSVFLFLFGIPLGLLSGLTGVSGSVFGVPAVRKLLGLRPARAVGVGLALAFFAAVAGILSYAQHGEVLWGLALLLFVFQTLGALLAERLLQSQPRLETLSLLWGSLVIVGGLVMLAHGTGHLSLILPAAPHTAGFYGLAAVVAVAVGLGSRVFGLGGVFLIPAAIYALGLAPHTAQGTALVVLALASLPGVLAHARRGDVEAQAATWLSGGAILGALTGALLAVTRLTDAALLVLFGLFLVIMGLMMFWRKQTVISADSSADPGAKLRPEVAPDPPLVSPAAAPDDIIQTPVEPAEAHLNHLNKKETPETIEVTAKPAAIPRIATPEHPSAQNMLEQKLKKLEDMTASKQRCYINRFR